MLRLPILSPDPNAEFPATDMALREPNGLLAAGGDLHPRRLLNAYRRGIFPWYSEGQPVLWWCPDPRMVFRTDGVRLSSRFRRALRRSDWTVCADGAFEAVIDACAGTPRRGQHGTWVTAEMRAAYVRLHWLGHAHSVEIYAPPAADCARRSGREHRRWLERRAAGCGESAAPALIGGIYGVAVGRMFFGESMFSAESGGSKAALAALAHVLRGWGWPLIDAQVENAHLVTLGAETMPRGRFLAAVDRLGAAPEASGSWRERVAPFPAATLASQA